MKIISVESKLNKQIIAFMSLLFLLLFTCFRYFIVSNTIEYKDYLTSGGVPKSIVESIMKSMAYETITKNDTHITIFLIMKDDVIGSINHTMEYEFGVMKELHHGVHTMCANPEKNVITMEQYVAWPDDKNITSYTEFFKVFLNHTYLL